MSRDGYDFQPCSPGCDCDDECSSYETTSVDDGVSVGETGTALSGPVQSFDDFVADMAQAMSIQDERAQTRAAVEDLAAGFAAFGRAAETIASLGGGVLVQNEA